MISWWLSVRIFLIVVFDQTFAIWKKSHSNHYDSIYWSVRILWTFDRVHLLPLTNRLLWDFHQVMHHGVWQCIWGYNNGHGIFAQLNNLIVVFLFHWYGIFWIMVLFFKIFFWLYWGLFYSEVNNVNEIYLINKFWVFCTYLKYQVLLSKGFVDNWCMYINCHEH